MQKPPSLQALTTGHCAETQTKTAPFLPFNLSKDCSAPLKSGKVKFSSFVPTAKSPKPPFAKPPALQAFAVKASASRT
jgi:hypothetical protein